MALFGTKKIGIRWVSTLLAVVSMWVVKPPLHPRDTLSLLPRQVSLPILNRLNGVADLIPVWKGNAIPGAPALHWQAKCFRSTVAWLELHNKTATQFGGGTLHLKVSRGNTMSCFDVYIFATPFRVMGDYYFRAREHTLEIDAWKGRAEYEYVNTTGISIFMWNAGMLGTFRAIREVFPLFSHGERGKNANIKFMEKYMGASFEARPEPSWVTNVNVDDIHSGDFLAITKFRGDAFHTLEKWVTGAYAGHSAVCLRDNQGKLWVAESGRDNEKGEKVIALLAWEEWWDFEVNKNDSDPHIALLPLHPDLRAKFNEPAA